MPPQIPGRHSNGFATPSITEEYKAQAVDFVINDHRPIAEVARNIGVHAMTLRN